MPSRGGAIRPQRQTNRPALRPANALRAPVSPLRAIPPRPDPLGPSAQHLAGGVAGLSSQFWRAAWIGHARGRPHVLGVSGASSTKRGAGIKPGLARNSSHPALPLPWRRPRPLLLCHSGGGGRLSIEPGAVVQSFAALALRAGRRGRRLQFPSHRRLRILSVVVPSPLVVARHPSRPTPGALLARSTHLTVGETRAGAFAHVSLGEGYVVRRVY